MSEQETTTPVTSDWWAATGNEEHQVVALYRVKDGQEMLLDSFDVCPETVPDFMDFQLQVKERYGGGIYVAVVRGERGQFGKRMRFAVYGLPKDEPAPKEEKQASGIDQLMALMMQQQQASEARMLAVLEKMAEKPAEPETKADPMDMLEKVASTLQKIGGAPKPEKGLFEQLREFKEAASLLGLEGGGAAEPAENWTPALVELLSGIREISSESEKTKRLQIAAELKKRQPALPSTQASKPAAEATKPATGMAGLLQVLNELVSAAEQGADVADVADQLIKAAPSAEVLRQLLEREDALEMLQKFNPKVGEHFDWFELLANEVLERLDAAGTADTAESGNATPEKPDVDNQVGRSGNTANTVTDEGTGKPRKAATRGKSKSAVVSQ